MSRPCLDSSIPYREWMRSEADGTRRITIPARRLFKFYKHIFPLLGECSALKPAADLFFFFFNYTISHLLNQSILHRSLPRSAANSLTPWLASHSNEWRNQGYSEYYDRPG